MVDNVTSIASAVNERVIGSRHENLAIVLLLLALPSFYRKILRQLLKIPRSMKYYYQMNELLRALRFLLGIFLFLFQSHSPL